MASFAMVKQLQQTTLLGPKFSLARLKRRWGFIFQLTFSTRTKLAYFSSEISSIYTSCYCCDLLNLNANMDFKEFY
jgi:hypothetical protein